MQRQLFHDEQHLLCARKFRVWPSLRPTESVHKEIMIHTERGLLWLDEEFRMTSRRGHQFKMDATRAIQENRYDDMCVGHSLSAWVLKYC